MPTPAVSWQTVPVRGYYLNADDTAKVGKVVFTIPVRVYGTTSTGTYGVIFPVNSKIEATIDANGLVQANIPAVDDPDITPQGWAVKVEEILHDGSGQTFYFQPKMADITDGIDLGRVYLLTNSAGQSAIITPGPSVPGPQGPPGADGADGADGAPGPQGPPGADGTGATNAVRYDILQTGLTSTDKARGRSNTGSVRAALFAVDDPQWGLACDGVTDDTVAFRALLAAAKAAADAGLSGTIWNPGLPIAISDTILVLDGVTLNAPTGGNLGTNGARIVAIGANAQVVFFGRGGKSDGWAFAGASTAKPTMDAPTISVTNGSAVVTVASRTNAQLDAMFGKAIIWSETTSPDNQTSVIVKTPGHGGAASGTVEIADTASHTVSSFTAHVGSEAFVNFVRPTARSFGTVSVLNAKGHGLEVYQSSNLNVHSLKVENCDRIGMIVQFGSAGFSCNGFVHLGHNGGGQLQFRDRYGSAAVASSAGGNTRDISIPHLLAESHVTTPWTIQVQSATNLSLGGPLYMIMAEPIATYANGTAYQEAPQRGSGAQNMVYYSGHYYKVKDGAGNFTSSTASPDLTKWDDWGTSIAFLDVLSEPESFESALNQIQLNGPTYVQGSSSNTNTAIRLNGDSRGAYPMIVVNGIFHRSQINVDCEWNQGPPPIFNCTFSTGPITISGTKATAKNVALGLKRAQDHSVDHNPVTGRDPMYHHYGQALGVENLPRGQAIGSLSTTNAYIMAFPFTPDAAGSVVNKLYANLAVIGATLSGNYRFGIGLWDETTTPTAPVYTAIGETADLTTAVTTGTNVGKKVGGALNTSRGHGLVSTYTPTRGVRHAFVIYGSGTTMPKFQGAALANEDAMGPPIMAIRLQASTVSLTDLPLPDAPLTFSTSTGGVSTGVVRLQGDT